ncbi:hypothetical protein N9L49_04320 [Rhodospirillales bacterium]|nr:hypothetical protein [Rhodospirillales bacterium]
MSTSQYANTISGTPIRLKDYMFDVIASFKGTGIAVFKLLCGMQADYDTRQRMKHLDDRFLADIGKTRAEVDAEANKPIWQH